MKYSPFLEMAKYGFTLVILVVVKVDLLLGTGMWTVRNSYTWKFV